MTNTRNPFMTGRSFKHCSPAIVSTFVRRYFIALFCILCAALVGCAADHRSPAERLNSAAWHDDIGSVRTLLAEGVNPNATDKYGNIPILGAALNHKDAVDVVDLLLAHGADANASDKDTPVLMEAIGAFNTDVALSLINHGADVNGQTSAGQSALGSAASLGNLTVVKELIKHGAQVNHQSQSGSTPLINAAHWGHKDIVMELLKDGADVGLKDVRGQIAADRALDGEALTPTHQRVQQSHPEIATLLKQARSTGRT